MDLRALDRKALDINIALIATINEDEYDLPTPCAKWNVRELVEHLADATFSFAGTTGKSYEEAADAATETFSQPGYLEQTVEFGRFGSVPGRTRLAAHLMDSVLHTWDLNKALGRPTDLDEELAAATFKIVSRMPMGPPYRAEDGVFHEPVPVPETASLTDRLVGLAGRSPGWSRV